VELNEIKLQELLRSPLAAETVEHLRHAIDQGMEVRITSMDKPTLTVGSRFYLDKLLANHFRWPPASFAPSPSAPSVPSPSGSQA
jgi:hypothetical protein